MSSRSLFISTILLLAACVSNAATIVANSTSQADRDTAYALTADGDTLQFPAGGPSDWTTTWTINKAIKVEGAGIGSTIITRGVAEGQYLIVVNIPAAKTNEIKGIEFRGGSVSGSPVHVQAIKVVGLNTDARRFRLDYCKFIGLTNGALVLFTTLGVADHNYFDFRAPAGIGYVLGNSWGVGSGADHFGDGAYAAADLFGTENFFFFEDNIFSNSLSGFHLTGADSQSGGRAVYRYNKFYACTTESHGLEAQRSRSGRAFEIYMNTFEGNGIGDIICYFRGAVSLVYSNFVFNYGATPKINLVYNRLQEEEPQPFGGADGRNPWDGNDGGNPIDAGTSSSAGTLTVTDNTKGWTTDQWRGYILRKTSGKAVTSVTHSGGTLTVNCTGHGFSPGDLVSLYGANQPEYNQLWNIASTNANSFTAVINYTPTTPATGTIKACLGAHHSEILANTATQLTFKDTVQNASYRLSFTPADTFEINKITKGMDMPGIGVGSDLNGVTTPSIPGGWNDQSVSPWYQWGNVRCTAGPATLFAAGTSFGYSFTPLTLIVAGVHASNGVAPAYTAYAYPHPMVSGNPPAVLPIVTVTASDPIASEAGDPGVFTISRDAVTNAFNALYSMSGSAVNGTDYSTLPGSVSFGLGTNSVTVTVSPIQDPDVEGSETAVLTLSADSAYTIGSPSSATVTITDDDVGPPPPTGSGQRPIAVNAAVGGRRP